MTTPTPNPNLFYKLDIQGIVYLVDPATATAYTYDVTAPVAIGTVKWLNTQEAPRIELYETWADILAAKKLSDSAIAESAAPACL